MSKFPATKAVTNQYGFHKTEADGQHLFSVRAGIPLSRAFDELTVLLSLAQSCAEATSDDDSDGAKWGASKILDFAFALTQAMHGGLIDHEKAQPRP